MNLFRAGSQPGALPGVQRREDVSLIGEILRTGVFGFGQHPNTSAGMRKGVPAAEVSATVDRGSLRLVARERNWTWP